MYAKDSKNSKNPENVESGSKSGSGIPEKKISQKIFFFNSEQLLLIAFFKKMVISAKKVCFLHFSYLPASASEPNCIYNLCSKNGQKNGKEFDRAQACPIFFPGKKPDPENPGKFRIPNFEIFWSDFDNGQQKLLFYGVI